MERRLKLNKEHLKELTMDELYDIVGDYAVRVSVLPAACQVVSAAIGIDCGRPSCGPGCTAISEGEQTH